MEIFIQQGESKNDCMLKIASKYNRQFQILSQKEIRVGGFLGLFSKPGIEVEYFFPQHRVSANAGIHPNGAGVHSNAAAMYGLNRHTAQDLEAEKKKVLAAANGAKQQQNEAAAGGRESANAILEMLNDIKNKVENTHRKEDHPSFVRVSDLLKANDFSQNYIAGMLEKLKKELSMEQLENLDTVANKLIEWIGESISVYKEEDVMRKPRIMVLIGPTGVGKTTTLSKLAAGYGIGTDENKAIDVKMITIDQFRICAEEQLKTIGSIMQMPVSGVGNKQDLRKEIALLSEGTDLILIDTIGKSPKDSAKIGEMKELLDGCPKSAEYHLVISAATKTSDMINIMQQFEPFNYKSVIITKMDETEHTGNVISAIAEKRKCVSFVTDGQNLAEDIKRASVVRFLVSLEGFKINREKIENRFPCGEADQFKWRG
ncbi:MAG: flagellar biosynthesis protein FlhF [Treponema sp.]|nr:flagellar biosynthesis protein FlhF [Treponema sp.]MCL2237810.1 flagellar biosynthesis protein FlhF [Treponema sp.]